MLLKMELTAPIRRGICEMRGTVYVNGKVATEADLVGFIGFGLILVTQIIRYFRLRPKSA